MKHALYSPFFFSSKCSLFHNANLFGSCVIHILYTGWAKIKKKNSGAKGLTFPVTTTRYIPWVKFVFPSEIWPVILAHRTLLERSTYPSFHNPRTCNIYQHSDPLPLFVVFCAHTNSCYCCLSPPPSRFCASAPSRWGLRLSLNPVNRKAIVSRDTTPCSVVDIY